MRLSSSFTAAALAAALAVTGAYPQTHRFTVEDLLSLERLGSTTVGWLRLPGVTFSPDGRWLAFVVERPRAAGERYSLAGLDGAARADIWVAPATGRGKPVNVTRGAREGRGYWCPTWSPDGRRLAMVSTDGNAVQIYVWNRAANVLSRMSGRGTDIGYTEITSPTGEVGPLLWKDETHLVAGLLEAGEAGTVLDRDRGVERFALLQWAQAKRGYQTTSNEIGSPMNVISRRESLAIIDVSQATVQDIGAVPSAGSRWIRISPGWQQGVVLTQVNPDPMHAGRPPAAEYLTQLGVWFLMSQGITWSDSRSITALLGWKQDLGFIVSARDKQMYSLSVPPAVLHPLPDGTYDAARRAEPPKQAVSPIPGGEALTTWRDRVVAKSEDRNGVHLWTCEARQPCKEVTRLNPQAANIESASSDRLEYTSAAGEKLKAVVMKPPGFRMGAVYPTIVWAYAGAVFRSVNDVPASIANPRWDNPQLLAAHGYVILFPSIPLKPYGAASDPYSDMAAGVIPAVEKAIEIGLADRTRLELSATAMGDIRHSACYRRRKFSGRPSHWPGLPTC